MPKADEVALFNRLREARREDRFAYLGTIEQLFAELGIHPKRAYRMLLKWEGNGWWDCGIHTFGGWFTDAAPERLGESNVTTA